MTPLFRPHLLNSPFGDPALYVGLQGEGKALLFDLGDISRTAPRLLLKISDVFISHTHIDHFIGFDHLLRLNLARERILTLYGPPGILRNVSGKLRGYTWNLTQDYPFVLDVHEIGARTVTTRRFSCRDRFRPGPAQRRRFDGTVVCRPHYRITTLRLEHNGIVSLGFRLEEHVHININKDALNKSGLPIGPWLQTFKTRIRDNSPGSTLIAVPAGENTEPRHLRLDDLTAQLVHTSPGEIIAYVADCGCTPSNEKKIQRLAAGAHHFFCEAGFLENEAAKALSRGHLTASQAGRLARESGAATLTPFHFSPRYASEPELLAREADAAFRTESCPPPD